MSKRHIYGGAAVPKLSKYDYADIVDGNDVNDGNLNIEALYNSIQNDIKESENRKFENAQKALAQKISNNKPRFQKVVLQTFDREVSAKNIGDFSVKQIYQPRFTYYAIPSSIEWEIKVALRKLDGTVETTNNNIDKYAVTECFLNSLIKKFELVRVGSLTILNNNKSILPEWKRYLIKQFYHPEEYGYFLGDDLLENTQLNDLSNAPNSARRGSNVSYYGLTRRKGITADLFSADGVTLQIPGTVVDSTFFSSHVPLHQTLRLDFTLELEKDTRKFLESHATYDTTTANWDDEKYKLIVIGHPKMIWKEVMLSDNASKALDAEIRGKDEENKLSTSNDKISSYTIGIGKAFQLLNYVQLQNTPEFTVQPDLFWQPKKLIIKLIPEDSWNHTTYFSTKFVDMALHRIKYLEIRNINLGANADRKLVFDWSKPDDKKRIYKQYRAVKTNTNVISSYESQVHDLRIKPGIFRNTYSSFWSNDNRSGGLVFDLTVDQGFTDNESFPKASKGLEVYIKFHNDALDGVYHLLIIGETEESYGLYNTHGLLNIDYLPKSILK